MSTRRCDDPRDLHFSLLDALFFFYDTATTEIYTLSLHDALPIFIVYGAMLAQRVAMARFQLMASST